MRRVNVKKRTAALPAATTVRRFFAAAGTLAAVAALVLGILFQAEIAGAARGAMERAAARLTDGLNGAAAWMGFAVREVLVVNRGETPRRDILAALDIAVGDSMLALDLDAIRARVESLGWVKSATVERRLPDRIVIYLTERRPAAAWQQKGRYYLVDAEGAILGPHDPARFPGLKIITGGPEARFRTGALVELLQETPELQENVIGAVWVGQRRWDLRLENGTTIRLPERQPDRVLRRLGELIRTRSLLNRDIDVIDARLPERITIRPSGKAASLTTETGAAAWG